MGARAYRSDGSEGADFRKLPWPAGPRKTTPNTHSGVIGPLKRGPDASLRTVVYHVQSPFYKFPQNSNRPSGARPGGAIALPQAEGRRQCITMTSPGRGNRRPYSWGVRAIGPPGIPQKKQSPPVRQRRNGNRLLASGSAGPIAPSRPSVTFQSPPIVPHGGCNRRDLSRARP